MTYRMLYTMYKMLCTTYTMNTYDAIQGHAFYVSGHKNIHAFIDFIHNLHTRSTGRSRRPTKCSQCPKWCTGHVQHDVNVTRYEHQICPRPPFSIFDNYDVYDFYFDVHNTPLTNENHTSFALDEPTKKHRRHQRACF